METHLTCQPPSLLSAGILMREGPTQHFPLRLTNETQEQKDAGPHDWTASRFWGGDEMQHLRDGMGILPFHPFHQQLHEGTVHTPIPQGSPPTCLPPVSACLLLTWSLGVPIPPGVCRNQPVRLSLSLLSLPTHQLVLSSAGYPASPRSHVHVMLSTCLPSFCLSVPDQRLTQLLTLFVPAHAVFRVEEGARKSWGGAPSNPRKSSSRLMTLD